MNQSTDKAREEMDERLLAWAAQVARVSKTLNAIGPSEQIVIELVRVASAAYARHGERGTLEFLQQIKDKVQCLFEARRLLILSRQAEFAAPGSLDELIEEADILMRMGFSAIATIEGKRNGGAQAPRSFEAPSREVADVPFEEGWRNGGNSAEDKPAAAGGRNRRQAAVR
ncbi:hypothetical protein [Nibricoccus sp. IMCC34717]|uniref:hypothetical protein n=1 Tax=Nibricoccus sp. IMCC34717 TaxID=3034021 RepID=UPI00384F2BDF